MKSVLGTIVLSISLFTSIALAAGQAELTYSPASCVQSEAPIFFHESQSVYFNNGVENGVNADPQGRYVSWPIGFSPINDSLLLTAHNRYDGQRDEVHLWDWRAGTSTEVFSRRFTEFVLSGTLGYWSTTGDKIALVHDGTLTVLDLEQNTSFDLSSYTFGASTVLWSSDGTQFAVPVGEEVLIWDAATGEDAGEAEAPGNAYQIVWTERNGFRWVIKEQIDDNTSRFTVWGENDSAPLLTIEGGDYYAVLSPNGDYLATYDEQINVWSVDTQQQTQTISIGELRDVQWSSDGCHLLYTEVTRELHPYFGSVIPSYWLEVWSLADETQVASIRESSEIRNIVASSELDYIAYSVGDEIIRVYGQYMEQP